MTEYYYPNEVEIKVENGKRCAYLKPNWKEIRKKNESKSLNYLSDEEWDKIRKKLFWEHAGVV